MQVVAGGFRNAYDIAFSRDGELFTHDSDMEADEGTSWYRPTRLLHVIPGAEYGWRSGWGQLARLLRRHASVRARNGPRLADRHGHLSALHVSAEVSGVMFSADWSQGKILAIKLERSGATWKGSSEVFLEGHPLNVTDIDIGQDGWLYFVTGGSRHQRRRVSRRVEGNRAGVRQESGTDVVRGGCGSRNCKAVGRGRTSRSCGRRSATIGKRPCWASSPQHGQSAGVSPASARSVATLRPAPHARSTAHSDRRSQRNDPRQSGRTPRLQADEEARDRLIACWATAIAMFVVARAKRSCGRISRSRWTRSPRCWRSDDRFEATAARRLLERQPVSQWKERALKSRDVRVIIQGGLALMTVAPSRDNGLELLQSISQPCGDSSAIATLSI